MARCECGGPDFVIVCPKGCGCICWDDPEWGQECISYCEGEELPDLDLAAVGPMVVKSPRELEKIRIDPDRHVRICAHDLPVGTTARVLSRLIGQDVWVPALANDRRISSDYEGPVSDICERLGLRL